MCLSTEKNSIAKSDILKIRKYLIFSLSFVLLSFSSSLATKIMLLNDETCIVGSTIIDLNFVELKFYPFVISLSKCSRSCNVLSPKICVPKETKDVNVKALNMIINKKKLKK